MSLIRASITPPPFTSRHASLTRVQSPKLLSAARSASSAVIPSRAFSAARIRRWKRSSSSTSRSTLFLRSSPRRRALTSLIQYAAFMTLTWPA